MRLAPLLPLLLLAGCLSAPPGGPAYKEVCLGLPMGVGWRQAGVHEALPEAARAAGLATEERLPSSGFAFTRDPPGLEGARVVSVQFRPLGEERSPFAPSVGAFQEPKGTRVFLSDARDEAHARSVFRAFLGGLGLSGAPQADAWERALLQVQQLPGTSYHAALLDLPPLADAAYALAAGADPHPTPETGLLILRTSHWEVAIATATRSLEAGTGFERVTLTTDPMGHVHGESVFASRDAGTDALLARLEDSFARLGLPPPTFDDLTPASARC